MGLYDELAPAYARGSHRRFSASLACLMPATFRVLGIQPADVLDVACGEGTFAVAMASAGFRVTGVDASWRMLGLAHQRARAQGLTVRLIRADMRALPFREAFDLITCWYDSLNYLPSARDLGQAFASAREALRPGGWYMFDMNTLYGLAQMGAPAATWVAFDSQDLFEVHRADFDHERHEARLHVTAFVREGEAWRRVDEVHREYGYRRTLIGSLLQEAGFSDIRVYESLADLSAPTSSSCRLFFLCRRPP